MPPFLLVVLTAGVGTYLLRVLPLIWASHVTWPRWFRHWISFMTPAILGTLLGPTLFFPTGHWVLPWANATLWATCPSALTAWYSRSLLLTLLVGMTSFAIFRQLI